MSRAVPLDRTAKRRHDRRRSQRRRAPASQATTSARRERQNPFRRLISGWFLGKVFALALLAGGSWATWHAMESPQLHVRRVTVSGNELVPTAEITEGLDVQGTSIFWIRRARLAKMVEGLPAVKHAEIQVRFPDHVHIVVRERAPVAIWDTGGRRMLVDADGVALREGDGMLPLILVSEGPIPEPGDRVDAEAVRITQELTPRLESLGLNDAQFDYRASSGVTLISRGRRVALGFADHLDAKLDAYRAIRDHLAQTQTVAELVDVRFLDRPYFR